MQPQARERGSLQKLEEKAKGTGGFSPQGSKEKYSPADTLVLTLRGC